jgi:hypothetical protein
MARVGRRARPYCQRARQSSAGASITDGWQTSRPPTRGATLPAADCGFRSSIAVSAVVPTSIQLKPAEANAKAPRWWILNPVGRSVMAARLLSQCSPCARNVKCGQFSPYPSKEEALWPPHGASFFEDSSFSDVGPNQTRRQSSLVQGRASRTTFVTPPLRRPA